jgi:hypothetical protein
VRSVNTKWHYAKSASDAFDAFNARVAGRESVAAIDKEDVHPGNTASGSADESPVQLSAAERELQRRWFAIEFGGQQDGGLSNEQKVGSRMDRQIRQISRRHRRPDTHPTGNPMPTSLQHKCALMHAAIMAAPPGPLTDRVIAQYVQLLQLNNISLELISSWYSEVTSFLSSADTAESRPGRCAESDGGERQRLR